MTRPNEPTKEGGELIRAMVDADQELQRARARVERAILELANATNAVGKWLVPDDADPNESFTIPYLDAFLNVSLGGVGMSPTEYKATWRNDKKPRRT